MEITKSLRPQWTIVAGLGVALVLAGGTVGCRSTGTAAAGPSAAPTSPAGASPDSTGDATTSPGGSPAPGESPSPATPGPGGCTAGDLAFQSTNAGFAAGSRYDTVVVVNRSAAACQLTGLPRLLYTDASGRIQLLPAEPEVTNLPPDNVAPGATAHFAIHTVNGYGGYDPSSPPCAHPAHYQGLLLDRPGGRVPLGNVRIDVLCDGIRISGWGWPDQQ